MIDLLHQRQQPTDFPPGETFAGKPVEVVTWQIGEQAAFVFAERHLAGYQQQQVFRFHRRLGRVGQSSADYAVGPRARPRRKNSGKLRAPVYRPKVCPA